MCPQPRVCARNGCYKLRVPTTVPSTGEHAPRPQAHLYKEVRGSVRCSCFVAVSQSCCYSAYSLEGLGVAGQKGSCGKGKWDVHDEKEGSECGSSWWEVPPECGMAESFVVRVSLAPRTKAQCLAEGLASLDRVQSTPAPTLLLSAFTIS